MITVFLLFFKANFGYKILLTYFRNDPFVTVTSYLSGVLTGLYQFIFPTKINYKWIRHYLVVAMYHVNSPSTNEARWVDDGAVHGILDTVDLRGSGELVEWRSYNSRLGADGTCMMKQGI